MPTTDYIVANGMMLGEVTNGVMRNYETDALGSVVTKYSNGTLENTYAYKPYGATLAKTGTASDPSFLWNGGSGYRAVTLFVVSYYVRARHFSSISAAWTSLDELWPDELAYGYASGEPVTLNDPTGLAGATGSGPSTGCCCKASIESTPAPTFPGTPYPPLKTKNQQCINSYGGWNAQYKIKLTYSAGGKGTKLPCTIETRETQYTGTACAKGSLKKSSPTASAGATSRTMIDWNNCVNNCGPQNCNGCVSNCTIHDDPGAAPCDKSGALLLAPFAYAVFGWIKIRSGCDDSCVKISYSFCEQWTSIPGAAKSVPPKITVTAC